MDPLDGQGREEPQGGTSSRLARDETSLGVLHDEAFSRIDVQPLGRSKPRLGIRLAVLDVGTGDRHRGNGQPLEQTTAFLEEIAVTGGDDGTRVIVQPRQGVPPTGGQDDTVGGAQLELTDARQGLGASIGADDGVDGLDDGHTVSQGSSLDPELVHPLSPGTLHRTGRVDEGAVEVEQDGLESTRHPLGQICGRHAPSLPNPQSVPFGLTSCCVGNGRQHRRDGNVPGPGASDRGEGLTGGLPGR